MRSNARRERFAREVAAGRSHTAAAIEAGYARPHAGTYAAHLMRFPGVKERINHLRSQRCAAARRAVEVAEKLDIPKDVSATPLFDSNGNAVGIFVPLVLAAEIK